MPQSVSSSSISQSLPRSSLPDHRTSRCSLPLLTSSIQSPIVVANSSNGSHPKTLLASGGVGQLICPDSASDLCHTPSPAASAVYFEDGEQGRLELVYSLRARFSWLAGWAGWALSGFAAACLAAIFRRNSNFPRCLHHHSLVNGWTLRLSLVFVRTRLRFF